MPVLGIAGLGLAWRSDAVSRFVRAYAAATSLGLIAVSAYMATIGWLGARS